MVITLDEMVVQEPLSCKYIGLSVALRCACDVESLAVDLGLIRRSEELITAESVKELLLLLLFLFVVLGLQFEYAVD